MIMGSISRSDFLGFTFNLSWECKNSGITYTRALNFFSFSISKDKSLSFHLANNRTVSLLNIHNRGTDMHNFSDIASLRNYIFRWIINNN